MPLPESPRDAPHVLRYAPLWMDAVFRSRSTTEALLSSQSEAGYLSPHDYEVSINFLTNWHRQYPVGASSSFGYANSRKWQLLGAIAGVGLVYGIRNPKWFNTKRAALTFALPFAGYSIGKMTFLSAHFKYLSSIENPHGFQKAMEHIQAQVGAPKGGIIMERPYQITPDDMIPDETQDNVPHILLPNPSDAKSPASAPHTKWDEIRAANSGSAQNSAWDKLRQQHERKDLKSNATGNESLWQDDSSEKADVDKYATKDTYDENDRYSDSSKFSHTR